MRTVSNRDFSHTLLLQRSRGRRRELLVPVVVITITGALLIIHLIACNRVPALETVADRLDHRIAQEQSRRMKLLRELDKAQHPLLLKEFAKSHGLTEQPPPEDVVVISPLPPVEPASAEGDQSIALEPALTAIAKLSQPARAVQPQGRAH